MANGGAGNQARATGQLVDTFVSSELIQKSKQNTVKNREDKLVNKPETKNQRISQQVSSELTAEIKKGNTGLTSGQSTSSRKPYVKEEQIKPQTAKSSYNKYEFKAKKEITTAINATQAEQASSAKSDEQARIFKATGQGVSGARKTVVPRSLDIVVIDESTPYSYFPGAVDEEYDKYRERYPKQNLIILDVNNGDGETIGTPQNQNRKIEYAGTENPYVIEYAPGEYTGRFNVSRSGEGEAKTNWYNLIKPYLANVSKVRVGIDNSGSMTTATIAPDLTDLVNALQSKSNATYPNEVSRPVQVEEFRNENWATWWDADNELISTNEFQE